MSVKNDRDEKITQRKSQDSDSAPAMEVSANKVDAGRRSAEKKKIKPNRLSHSVTAGHRK